MDLFSREAPNIEHSMLVNTQNQLEIENMICIVRGQKVMFDSSLAELYGVQTKVLNQAVKRNTQRFPSDFMFQLTKDEFNSLRSQFVTSKRSKGGRQFLPYVFTEFGVAMLSSVLNSEEAIQVNISIIRTFIALRKNVFSGDVLITRLNRLEVSTNQLFKLVFDRLDSVEAESKIIPTKIKKIGFKS